MTKRYTLREIETHFLGMAASPYPDSAGLHMVQQMLTDLDSARAALEIGRDLQHIPILDASFPILVKKFENTLSTLLVILKEYERPHRGVDNFR